MVNAEYIIQAVKQAVDTNTLIGDLLSEEAKEFLITRSVVKPANPGALLCRQNQRDRRVYVIIKGEVEISREAAGKQMVLGRLGSGEIFGEVAALVKIPRTASVTATCPTVLLEIPVEVLEELLERSPAIRDAMVNRCEDRVIEASLRNATCFAALTDEQLAPWRRRAKLMNIPKNGLIIREGDTSDGFYIINRGIARVFSQIDGQTINLSLLQAGDYFGEYATLNYTPRTASVAALTDIKALRISTEDFMHLTQRTPEVRFDVDLVAIERYLETQSMRDQPQSASMGNLLAEVQAILEANG
jgi:CRP/FNR family cyclic AMP-dependent transcriptional regulator